MRTLGLTESRQRRMLRLQGWGKRTVAAQAEFGCHIPINGWFASRACICLNQSVETEIRPNYPVEADPHERYKNIKEVQVPREIRMLCLLECAGSRGLSNAKVTPGDIRAESLNHRDKIDCSL